MRRLTTILLSTEDILRALEVSGHYEYAGTLRASFTKKKQTLLRISPSSKTEFIYEEIVRPAELVNNIQVKESWSNTYKIPTQEN